MMLFKDRSLNIAILISVMWHFAFIFSIKPVFSTGHIVKHDTSIAFLGDILENVGSYIAEDSSAHTPLDQVKAVKQILLKDKVDRLEPVGAGFINTQPKEKEFLYSLGDRGSLEVNMYRKKETARVNFSDFFIKGDARDRVIIYKPDLGKVTVLPSDFSSGFSANIRFRISKEGFVTYVECAMSSGFSEIDQAAMRYVRKWQFVPANEDGQEGIARVSFK